jgi:hypothetical protein
MLFVDGSASVAATDCSGPIKEDDSEGVLSRSSVLEICGSLALTTSPMSGKLTRYRMDIPAAHHGDLACRPTCRLFSTLRSASSFFYFFGAGASKACNSFELGLGFALRATMMSDGRTASP